MVLWLISHIIKLIEFGQLTWTVQWHDCQPMCSSAHRLSSSVRQLNVKPCQQQGASSVVLALWPDIPASVCWHQMQLSLWHKTVAASIWTCTCVPVYNMFTSWKQNLCVVFSLTCLYYEAPKLHLFMQIGRIINYKSTAQQNNARDLQGPNRVAGVTDHR